MEEAKKELERRKKEEKELKERPIKLKKEIEDMGFLLKETDPVFQTSPAAEIQMEDVSLLRQLPQKIENMKKGKGEKGDKPIAGIDFPLPKDGKDAILPRIPIFIGKKAPKNPVPGDIWIKT